MACSAEEFYKQYFDLEEEMMGALKEAYEEDDVKYIQESTARTDYLKRHGTLDKMFREFLIELAENEAGLEHLKALVSLSIKTVRMDDNTVSPGLPAKLLFDIFHNNITVESYENMFNFIDNNLAVWREEIFFESCKDILLRTCNELTLKVSHSTLNYDLCWKIPLFLSKLLPISEPSGLNLEGEFNVGDGDSISYTPCVNSNDEDCKLYEQFWSLQGFLKNPSKVLDNNEWPRFRSDVDDMLLAFKETKLRDDIPSYDSTRRFSEYVTSPDELNLLLADVTFRRQVLVQILIIFQHFTTERKLKNDINVNNDQKDWMHATRKKINKILKKASPDAKDFFKNSKKLLKSEKDRIKWKSDGCQGLEPPHKSSSPPSIKVPKKTLGEIIKEADKEGRFEFGNAELNRLWNSKPDNLEACRSPDRDFVTSFETYIEKVYKQLDKKDQSNLLDDGSFVWKCLRLLEKRRLYTKLENDEIIPARKYLEKTIGETKITGINKVETGEICESDDSDKNVLILDCDYSDLEELDKVDPQKLDKKVDREVHRTVDKKVLSKAEQKVDKKVLSKAEQKVDKKVLSKAEQKVDKKVLSKAEQKVDKKVLSKAEQKVYKKFEQKIHKVDQKGQKRVDLKDHKKVDLKDHKKVDVKDHKKVELKDHKKVDLKYHKKVGQKVNQTVDQKVGKKIDKKVDQKVENEVEKIVKNGEAQNILRFKAVFLPESHFDAIAKSIAHAWKTVALNLGFNDSELEFFQINNIQDVEAAKCLLNLWLDNDYSSTLDKLLKVLKNIAGMDKAVLQIKFSIKTMKKIIIE